MYKIVFDRIRNDYKITIINILGIVLVFTVSLFILNLSNSSTKKLEYSLKLFADSNILLKENLDSNYLTELNMGKLRDKFGEENITRQNMNDLSATATGYSINIVAIDSNFINNGVEAFDYNINKSISQKVDLLYGSTWEDGTNDQVVILDEDTALNTFGHKDVVGQDFYFKGEYYAIVGVVQNTNSRNTQMLHCKEINGDKEGYCLDTEFHSTVYLPYSFSNRSQLYYNGNTPEYVIVNVKSKNIDKAVDWIKSSFNLDNSVEGYTVVTKNNLIEVNKMESPAFYSVLIILNSLIITLGIFNIINSFRFTLLSRQKDYGIMLVNGASNKDIFLLLIFEGFALGLISAIFIAILSFLSIIIYSLFAQTIKYFSLIYYLQLMGIIFLTLPFITLTINSFLWFSIKNKKIVALLKEEGDNIG